MMVRTVSATLLFVSLFPWVAGADESRVCTITRTVVDTKRSVLLRCNELAPSLPAIAELHIVEKTAPGDPRVTLRRIADAEVQDVPGAGPRWKRIVLSPSASPLELGNRYFVHIPPSAGDPHPSGSQWKPFWHEVVTEFEATITDAAASIDSGGVLWLTTDVALQPVAVPPPATVSLALTRNGREVPLPAIFVVSQPAPIGPGADPAQIGRVKITLTGPRLTDGKVKLTVKGLTDLFDSPVQTGAKARTEILGKKLSGLSKDEVGTYLKFAHEAVRKTRPVWVVDSKLAVELPQRLRGWRVSPTASADIGFGPSESSNTMKFGVAFTRFDLSENPRESFAQDTTRVLQGVRTSAAPTFETDRQINKRNLIVDLNGELFFRDFYNPLQKQNRRRLMAAREADPDIEMDDIVGASFGWAITSNLGVETGHALVSTTVTAGAHGILRLRPRLGILLEFKRWSLNIQGTGRLLAVTEHVFIEASDSFSVQEFDGWHGSGEVTFSIPLTPRTALDSTWKVGRQPPQFQRVNAVQTGLAFRF